MPTEGKFVQNPAGWNQAFHSWTGTLGTWLRDQNEKMAMVARVEAPKSRKIDKLIRTQPGFEGSGLAESIITSYGYDIDNELQCKTIANKSYAKYVHEGTQPHRIKADGKDHWLTFFWPSKATIAFAKEVNHPGTKPNRFLHRAMAKVF